MIKPASIYETRSIEQLRRELRLDSQALRRFRNALLKHGQSDSDALAELPTESRDAFADQVDLHAL
ncbi:MAG: 23S rRNA (adenine(2503)-C(2))-methyltransferase RlmN, partial [Pirellulales bacterium]|nr:23S rRNA (adenine(2503)-C(2))-methyltransferase RlmN [Pirellulales bacterium]